MVAAGSGAGKLSRQIHLLHGATHSPDPKNVLSSQNHPPTQQPSRANNCKITEKIKTVRK